LTDAEIKKVEKDVLSVYRRVNPSTYQIDEGDTNFKYREDMRERMFRDNLKFPIQMFKGAKLLDFGSGTGEHAIFYSRWGADCTLVEMNDLACNRIRSIFSEFAPKEAKYKIIESSLFDVDLDEKFDIVASEGVLHHTAGKEQGFKNLVSHLKKDGYAILGIATKSGQFQRDLQRMILYRFADSEKDIEIIAERLFKNHIDRAEKFGRRTRQAIIFDTYVNPRYDTPSIAEVQKWFVDNGLRFYSAWPNFMPPILGDSPGKHSLGGLQLDQKISAVSELFNLSHNMDDQEAMEPYLEANDFLGKLLDPVVNEMCNVTPESKFNLAQLSQDVGVLEDHVNSFNPYRADIERITSLIGEISVLIKLVESGNLEELAPGIKKFKQLFKGTAGLGVNYFIGYKE
jgi:SAM-dependent methyltransferase